MIGFRLEELLGRACASGFGASEFLIKTAATTSQEVKLIAKSPSSRCLLIGIGDISYLRQMQRDLLASEEARDRLISFDSLTNLPNRDNLREYLQALLENPEIVDEGGLIAVVGLRLNSARHVNEKFGQRTGDELIKAFANKLNSLKSSHMRPFRLRGVVFLCLVTGYKSLETLQKAIHSIRATLPRELNIDGHSVELEISCGAAAAVRSGRLRLIYPVSFCSGRIYRC